MICLTHKFAILREAVSRIKDSSTIKKLLRSLQDEMDELKRENAELSAANAVYREWKGSVNKNPSYADATRTRLSQTTLANAGGAMSPRNPIRGNHAVIVYPNDPTVKSSETTKQLIKVKVPQIKTSSIGIDKMKSIKNNGVIINCRNENDKNQLSQMIKENNYFKVVQPKKRNPVLSILIEPDTLDEETDIVDNIYEKNSNLPSDEQNRIKVIHMKITRSGNTIYLLDAPPPTFQVIRQQNFSLFVGCVRTIAREKSPVMQ